MTSRIAEIVENGQHFEDAQNDLPSRKRQTQLPEFIMTFTWQWFASTMATGSIAVVLFQTPYRFPGLLTIGKIVFLIDIISFLIICAAITTRFVLGPRALKESLYDSKEAFFFGAFWVSVALILQNISQYGTPKCGPWLVKALEVSFWLYFVCIVVVAVGQYHALFIHRNLNIEKMTPMWLLPIYPLLVTGPLAAVIVQSQPPDRASPIWVCGVASQGLGWMVTVFMYAMFALRLLTEDIPAPPLRPGMYIAVGPTGYTVTAIISLGMSAAKGLPNPFLGEPPAAAAPIIKVVAIIAGTFLWLLCFWFFALSTVAVVHGSRKMTPNLTWWGFIFPNAGLTMATIQLGKAYDSPGIKYLASVMTAILFLGWIAVGVSIGVAARKGKIS